MRQRKWWHPYPGTFRPIWVIVEATGRSANTIWTWIKQGKLTTVCDIRTREVLIDATEASTLDKQSKRRNRA